MSTRKQEQLAKIISEPNDFYRRPRDVIKDRRFQLEEKIKILESWENEQNLLLKADAENMPRVGANGLNSEILQEISTAKDHLQEELAKQA